MRNLKGAVAFARQPEFIHVQFEKEKPEHQKPPPMAGTIWGTAWRVFFRRVEAVRIVGPNQAVEPKGTWERTELGPRF